MSKMRVHRIWFRESFAKFTTGKTVTQMTAGVDRVELELASLPIPNTDAFVHGVSIVRPSATDIEFIPMTAIQCVNMERVFDEEPESKPKAKKGSR